MGQKIFVTVKPRAHKDEIKQLGAGEFQVSVRAPAEDGKANQAVIELLARHFAVAKSAVKIVRGGSARKKLIEIV